MHPVVGRAWQAIVTFFGAITIGFVLINQLPRGAWQILAQFYTPQEIRRMSYEELQRALERIVGYNAQGPLWQQYLDYLEGILTLNFGTSILYSEPVFDVLAPAVPWSVLLSSMGLFINTTVAFTLGVYMAYREGSRFDVGATLVSLILGSLPTLAVAVIFLIFLGFQSPLFPSGGRFNTALQPGFNLEFSLSVLHHAILPVLSTSVTGFAALGLRAHGIRVLGSDYIRVARLRGLRERRIVFHYVFRNSILPFYTGLVMGLTGILGSSVIIEFLYQYPAMGWYLFKSAAASDIPMVLGTFTFFVFASVITLLVVDFTYSWIDPRAEGVGTDEAF